MTTRYIKRPGAQRLRTALAAGALLLAAGWLQAQTDITPAAQAQRIYESDLAACNSGQLPAPLREACVREAGARLDRVRGVAPADVPVATPDGRATVITPDGAPPPPTSSDTVPTPDGRANVVPAR